MGTHPYASNAALAAALEYAKRGFHVFPIYEPNAELTGCSCAKRQNCTSPAKHPRTRAGFKDASIDPKQITRWWTKYPDASIGIATGTRSNVVVLDVDDRHGGPETLDTLVSLAGPLPLTLTALTGNGVHYHFRAPEVPLRSNTGILGPGIDIRADGGYVVVPPSRHATGKKYEFIDPEAELAPLPSWITTPDRSMQKDAVSGEQSPIPEGSRNNTLTSIAGRLRRAGAEFSEILATLMEVNRSRCEPPLPDYEVDAIAKNVSKYPVGTHTGNPEPLDGSGFKGSLPWFKLDTIWWNGNVNIAMMTAEERGWYISLLIRAWPSRGRLPADMSMLATLAGAKKEKDFSRRSGLILDEFEQQVDSDGTTFLLHKPTAQNYADAIESWQQKRAAGLASAAARKRKAEEAAA